NVECIGNQWEGEAPAELTMQWFGRSLTLPSKERVGQGLIKHVYCVGSRFRIVFRLNWKTLQGTLGPWLARNAFPRLSYSL
ncbi:MAG: hypothetical protein ACOVLE_17795, partial [Pirellula staleyi]